MFDKLISAEDKSVNFVQNVSDGYLEARYVRRSDRYFVIYLSSQSGCNRGCKFCHLTATGQTSYINATREDYLSQAKEVMQYYLTQPKAQEVNYNWMARGEALANYNLLEGANEILGDLSSLAIKHNLIPKFNVSTIMPKTLKRGLADIFKGYNPTIYYSLYSLDKNFREKWMPGAMEPEMALDNLKEYQEITNKIINLHWAFIENENDSIAQLEDIVNLVNSRELLVNFNLVRYNPFSDKEGRESPEDVIQRNYQFLKENLSGKVKIINRVGFDVKASCGMFVEK